MQRSEKPSKRKALVCLKNSYKNIISESINQRANDPKDSNLKTGKGTQNYSSVSVFVSSQTQRDPIMFWLCSIGPKGL